MFNKIDKPLIMGILNITPDSFSDGGLFTEVESAVKHAKKMMAAGVDIIDIGGESTRPGSDSVAEAQQIVRVVPIIKAIRKQLSDTVLISIDTTISGVANAALKAGANIVNDISAGQSDAAMFKLVSKREVPIILMHKKGTPKTMQENPSYEEVVSEVVESLMTSVEEALEAGIKKHNIAIDPGIGFGKRREDNINLLAHLEDIVKMGYPVLLGTSRKRFMGSLCSVSSPKSLGTATAVTTALGIMAGVKIFRVHDVEENRQAADVAWAIKQAKEHSAF
ncbi:MAG: dihydropteroate synthase [Methylococcales bacterium]|nr:dihydropteroate synthase [Methylococcales bacterium]